MGWLELTALGGRGNFLGMAVETELKFACRDLAGMRDRLRGLGALSGGLHFERNQVFDTPGRGLRSRGVLLRLRQGAGCVLTVKWPAGDGSSRYKVREELETSLGDCDQAMAMLRVLGYEVALVYEKVREEFEHMGSRVCLDILPFGEFVEIEGGEGDITACASSLDLDPERSTAASYHQLNREHRRRNGLPPDDSFVFSEPRRSELLEWVRDREGEREG